MPDNRCCFCLNLRFGTVLVAVFNALVNVVLLSVYLNHSTRYEGSVNVEWLTAAAVLLQLILDAHLAFAASKRLPNQTLPWLSVNGLVAFVLLVLLTLLFLLGYVKIGFGYTDYVYALVVIGVLAASHLFCCLVVFQFRKNLLEEFSRLQLCQGRQYAGFANHVKVNKTVLLFPGDNSLPRRDEADEEDKASAPPSYESAVKSKPPPKYDAVVAEDAKKPSAPPYPTNA